MSSLRRIVCQKCVAVVAAIVVTLLIVLHVLNDFEYHIDGINDTRDVTVDFRIIVLTFNRPRSLNRLLQSLNDLELDGDVAAIDIWIDRSKDTNQIDDETLSTAFNFKFKKRGVVNVHVQKSHAGIYGQWIDTWKPEQTNGETDGSSKKDEIVLILEDDLSISPFAYRWLKASYKFYRHLDGLAGITLQSEGLIRASDGNPFFPSASDGVAFLYKLMGSWGFTPVPEIWSEFRRWFHAHKNTTYRPYVTGIIMTKWYKNFEKRKTEDSMWTMWFINFCVERNLFTLYSNLNALEHTKSNSLAVNRREPGLHFHGKGIDNTYLLLRKWNNTFVNFRETLHRYGFKGERIQIAKN